MLAGKIVFALLVLAALVQLVYYFVYFIRLGNYKLPTQFRPVREGVSVIVVAKNELRNLEANLESLLNQSYPEFEVIVVNNGSWDKSQQFLEEMEQRYSHLRIVKIIEQEKYPKGKKFGLTLGIKASRYENLLLTDADCHPAGNKWLEQMQHHFTTGKDIVLGYSPYRKANNLLNLFIRFETLYTAIQYLSFALAGKAYMGVGRNLAYKKQLFFGIKGFASHNHIISGDDDLFINETATAENVAICITPESFVMSEPKNTFATWFRQKRRHLSTGKYYQSAHKWRLAWLNLSHMAFYPAFVAALFFPETWIAALVVFGVRLICQYIIFGRSMKKLHDVQPLWFLPLLDIMYFGYYLIMGMVTLFSKRRKTWIF